MAVALLVVEGSAVPIITHAGDKRRLIGNCFQDDASTH